MPNESINLYFSIQSGSSERTLISLTDKIPSDDEVFSTTAYGYLFKILAVANKSIQRVRVEKLPDGSDGDAAGDESGDEACQNEE